jgi:copper chaperone NosL
MPARSAAFVETTDLDASKRFETGVIERQNTGNTMKNARPNRRNHVRECEHVTASEDEDRHGPIPRRGFLFAGSVVGAGLLAGCSSQRKSDGGPPDPVSLAANVECDVCGMVISEHPGPNGQIFYRDNSPETHDNPARFDSLKACLFPYYFEHEQLDWTAEVVYVTNYSQVDYGISTVEGQKYIRTATGSDTFVNASEVVFVVESEVQGAMGPDFIPFSEESDGASFADEFGGQTVTMDDITPEMLGR